MPLDAPAQQGDLFQPSDCLGHTMIVAPTEFIEHIQTVNTKPGEKSPAIRVNVVDFADPDNPAIYRGALWFGVISGNLRRQVGSFLAGRMGQGQASPGRNAPWQLNDVTSEADWMAFLNNWLDNTPAGADFQAESITETNRAATTPTVAPVAPVQAAAPAVAAPAPAAPVAAPPATRAAPAPAAAPPASAAPTLATAAPDPMQAIAGLPPEEMAKVMAILAAQGQAAH